LYTALLESRKSKAEQFPLTRALSNRSIASSLGESRAMRCGDGGTSLLLHRRRRARDALERFVAHGALI
jgi:hypothetical protein